MAAIVPPVVSLDTEMIVDDEGKIVRSVEASNRAFILFKNLTNHFVKVIWINYQGRKVYYVHLAPRSNIKVDSYHTHPWIVEDAHTGERMKVDGKMVFYPRLWNLGNVKIIPKMHLKRQVVRIHFGIRPLAALAEETVALRLEYTKDADDLNLPGSICRKLKKCHMQMNDMNISSIQDEIQDEIQDDINDH
ncbi:Protein Vhl [Sergentomyia squamirostris]